MVRTIWCLAFLAAGLVLARGLAVPVRAEAPKAPRALADRQAENVKDGYGLSEETARDRARENARNWVVELLRKEVGDANWDPPTRLLDLERLEKEFQVISAAGEPKESINVGGDTTWVVRYKVHLTEDYLRAVQKQGRQELVMDRHLLLARVLGGVLAVLLIAAGYLRLEEMTRGYATHLLRLAAFALLGLAGFALWLTV
jgi:hypothetical protein